VEIRLDDPTAPYVADLLALHLEELRSVMGEHAQALDASGLSAAAVTSGPSGRAMRWSDSVLSSNWTTRMGR
jgi:hypothetical protein